MAIVRPVKYKNLEFNDYGIDDETGELWSFKKTTPKKIKPCHHTYGYVAVCVTDSQLDKPTTKKPHANINLHTLVAHTLFDIPIPEGVSEELWEKTDETIKSACRGIFQVNHKDHDRSNYRPDNLEFVTASGNIRAALIHYKEKLGIKYFGELQKGATKINNKKNDNKFASLESFFG
jgi:hypothetical protein